ncbi:MAG: alcohol dehydrogenase, partial [Corynebacterium sp.]|nr:alcohol dehydrogenase [Corynebacterium sp.]
LTVHGVSFGFTRDAEMARTIAGLLPEVVPAVARGEIRPVIDSTLAASDVDSLVTRLRSGDADGKIVLTF